MPVCISRGAARSLELCRSPGVSATKARQSAKICEIANALASAGFGKLDEQARALGLCRSTTWTIVRANHKSPGLSAIIIKRMLAAPGLPVCVRTKVIEYAEEKAAGLYGHSKAQRRRFIARLLANSPVQCREQTGASRIEINIERFLFNANSFSAEDGRFNLT